MSNDGKYQFFRTQKAFNTDYYRDIKNNVVDVATTNEKYLYVTEWIPNNTDIIAVGCNQHGEMRQMTVNLKYALFVVTNDLDTLESVLDVFDYGFEDTGICLASNNFAVHDLLFAPGLFNRPCKLIKIHTQNYFNTTMLHNFFRRSDPMAYKYVGVSHYWDIYKQIMMEMYARHRTMPDKASHLWLTPDLVRIVDLQPYRIPIITFDVETVSSNPTRVPTGDDVDDHLFTVAIHLARENELFTLVYIPYDADEEVTSQQLCAEHQYETYYTKTASGRTPLTHHVLVYHSEVEILQKTLDILKYKNRIYILSGYNTNYDVKFLLVRSLFYNLPDSSRFYWNYITHFGYNQIHLDFFRIVMLQYRFEKYSLNAVAENILKMKKVDVDSVKLRYLFFGMRKYKDHRYVYKYQSSGGKGECEISLRDTVHYNNVDTLLVSELIEKTNGIDFLIQYFNSLYMPERSVNSGSKNIQVRVLNDCFNTSLRAGRFFGTFKDKHYCLPKADDVPEHILYLDSESYLNDYVQAGPVVERPESNAKHQFHQPSYDFVGASNKRKFVGQPEAPENAKYPGGANYCHGMYDINDVQEYDYAIAYPLLIDRLNISDETCGVYPANVICGLWSRVVDPGKYICFDYISHTCPTKTETFVLYYKYLYEDYYCGGHFAFTQENLRKRGDNPVIVIWVGRRGILSDVINKFNSSRTTIKEKKKTLGSIMTELQDYLESTHSESTIQLVGAEPVVVAKEDESEDSDSGDDEALLEALGGQPASSSDDDDDEEFLASLGAAALNEPATAAEKQTRPFDFAYDDDAKGCDDPNEVIAFETFESPYITLTRSFDFEIKIGDIPQTQEGRQTLLRLITQIELEMQRCENLDLLKKVLNSSVYGCIGAISKSLAASITCIIRSTILSSASLIQSKYNTKIYYMDTDSFFVEKGPTDVDYSSVLNERFPYTQITKKEHPRIVFVTKKTYYRLEQGKLKYGLHKNGPPMWRTFIEYFYFHTQCRTIQDITGAFAHFIGNIYDSIERDASRVLDLVVYRKTVQEAYKTQTPEAELNAYVRGTYPQMVGIGRYDVFYKLDLQNFDRTTYRLLIDLENGRFAVRDINLFKFFNNVLATVHNIVVHQVKSHTGTNVYFDIGVLRRSLMNVYIKMYNARFYPESQAPQPTAKEPKTRAPPKKRQRLADPVPIIAEAQPKITHFFQKE